MTYQIPVFRSAGNQLIDQLLRNEGLTIFGKIACFVDDDAKNRLSLSILVLEKQLQTLSSLKMKATLVNFIGVMKNDYNRDYEHLERK